MTRPARLVYVVLPLLLAASACGGGASRPDAFEWRAIWEPTRDSMPTAGEMVTGGEDLCGELVGDLRSVRNDLVDTPDDALDDVVDDWIAEAEAIAFDCPIDQPEKLAERLQELSIITAEVDAGLAAYSAG